MRLKIGANKGLQKAEIGFTDKLKNTLISDFTYEGIKKSFKKLLEMLWAEMKEQEIILDKSNSKILIEKSDMLLEKL